MGFVSLLLIFAAQTHAALPLVVDPCEGLSQELEVVKDADQLDRGDSVKLAGEEINDRDRQRRERVASIFADGCFKTARDYANAALVFQHGTVPDHFFQAYLWASKAAELGDEGSKTLMAAAIDRYLMNKGYKEIYATQARILPETHGCHCLWPVEATSTDEDRRKLGRNSLADQLTWVASLDAGKTSCGPPAICTVEAKPVPRGSIPGVAW